MTKSEVKAAHASINALVRLLGSHARLRLLQALFVKPDRSWALNELSQSARVDPSAAHRELANLQAAGIVCVASSGGRRLFRLDASSPLSGPLSALLTAKPGIRPLFVLEEMQVDYQLLTFSYLNVDRIGAVLAENGIASRMRRTLDRYENGGGLLCFDAEDLRAISRDVFAKLVKDPRWGLKDSEKILRLSGALMNTADRIRQNDHVHLKDAELADCFDGYFDAYMSAHTPGWIQNSVDMPDMLLSNHLLSLVKEKVKAESGRQNAAEAFSRLTTPVPPSTMQREYESLLRLLVAAGNDTAVATALRCFSDLNATQENTTASPGFSRRCLTKGDDFFPVAKSRVCNSSATHSQQSSAP